jgi:signal transduction histidine kinase
VNLEVDPGDALPITCDPRKVKQVLVNLLQNALDATPRGGRVMASTSHDASGAARFVIDDSGPGLTDEVRGRLFTPGATTKAAGSGLGLVIARAIAEQHGGTLTLSDRPEGGCRAELCLPKWPPAEPAAPPSAPPEVNA